MSETWPSCGHTHVSSCWYCYLERGKQLSAAEAALKEAEQRADEQARLVESVEFFRDTATERADAAEAQLARVTQERDRLAEDYNFEHSQRHEYKAQLTRVREALEALIQASDGCAGHRNCNHGLEAWVNARRLLAEPAAGAPEA